MSVYRITASTVTDDTEFGQGALIFFELEAGSLTAAKKKIYTEHPDVKIAWIGDDYLKPRLIDWGLEGSKDYIEIYGPKFYIYEPLDYIRSKYALRLEASKLPKTIDDEDTIDFEGWRFYIKNGCIVAKSDGVKRLYPYEPCGLNQHTIVKIPYEAWRRAMVRGKFKWIWA